MTDEEARALLARLSDHYGEPVKPIGQYCAAFRTWQNAIEEAYTRETEPALKADFEAMIRDIANTRVLVTKSNLLWRLLYEGEGLRTEPCPIHKGHWSGCAWGDDQCPHCMSGDNITGWLENKKG